MTTRSGNGRLAELLQSLPRELYDIIYHLTFAADAGETYVDYTYLPPARLQVSRATREHFAMQYYQQTVFHGREAERSCLVDWLRSLDPHHVASICDIRYDTLKISDATDEQAMNDTAKLMGLRVATAPVASLTRQGEIECFYTWMVTSSGKEMWSNLPTRDCRRH